MTIADGVKDRRIGLSHVRDLPLLGDQRSDGPYRTLGQRHLHEDQRIVGHGGVKEGEAASIFGESGPEIFEAVDLVHGLVRDDLLQHAGRGVPVDSVHHQEPAVEPRNQQVTQIGVQRPEVRPLIDDGQEIPTHLYEPPGSVGDHVQPPEEPLARRLHGLGQRRARLERRMAPVRIGRFRDGVRVRFQVFVQELEELQTVVPGEGLIGGENFVRQREARCLPAMIEELTALLGQGGGRLVREERILARSGEEIPPHVHDGFEDPAEARRSPSRCESAGVLERRSGIRHP